MDIRQIDGKTVLSYFNASTLQHGGPRRRRPDGAGDGAGDHGGAARGGVARTGRSLPPPFDNRLAQPYGGYISPGSTLDELRIFVSQWNNTAPRARAPYRVIQFAVNPFKPGLSLKRCLDSRGTHPLRSA